VHNAADFPKTTAVALAIKVNGGCRTFSAIIGPEAESSPDRNSIAAETVL